MERLASRLEVCKLVMDPVRRRMSIARCEPALDFSIISFDFLGFIEQGRRSGMGKLPRLHAARDSPKG